MTKDEAAMIQSAYHAFKTFRATQMALNKLTVTALRKHAPADFDNGNDELEQLVVATLADAELVDDVLGAMNRRSLLILGADIINEDPSIDLASSFDNQH